MSNAMHVSQVLRQSSRSALENAAAKSKQFAMPCYHAENVRISGHLSVVLTGPNRPAVRSWKRPVDALELELGTCMS